MSCKGCSPQKVATALKALAIGAYKIAKASLGADAAPLPVIQERRSICKACPDATPCRKSQNKCWCGPLWDGLTGTRETCGCNLEYKTVLSSESCPLGKWNAVNANNQTQGNQTRGNT